MPPANTRVQAVGTVNVTITTLAYSSNVTAGNLLIVTWRTNGTTLITSITDTLTNSYTIVYSTSDTGPATGGWAYALSKASGGNTVTFSTGVQAVIAEYSGANTVRATVAGKVASTTTPVSNPIAVQDGDLVIGVNEAAGPSATTAAGAGYNMAAVGTGPTTLVALEDNLNATANAALTAGFTGTAATASVTGIGAFYFNPASGNVGTGFDVMFRGRLYVTRVVSGL